MSKLTRVVGKVFGSGAGVDQISVFGSLFAGSSAFTTDPATAQSLSNFLTGWNAAAIGGNAPAIEDMNSVLFVLAYQIAYLLQAGVAEWNTATPYYIGSLVNDGFGLTYKSLTDNNQGNALTDSTNWVKFSGPANVATKTANYTLTTSDGIIFCNDSGGSFSVTLPTAVGATGMVYTIKKANAGFSTNVSLLTSLGEGLNGQASGFYKLKTLGETYRIVSDGVGWQIIQHDTMTSTAALTLTMGSSFGTVTGQSSFWTRVNDRIRVWGTATAGTMNATSGPYLQLPSGLVIDFTKVAAITQIGTIQMMEPTSAPTQYPDVNNGPFALWVDGVTTNQVFDSNHLNNNTFDKYVNSSGNNSVFVYSFEVPMTDWNI